MNRFIAATLLMAACAKSPSVPNNLQLASLPARPLSECPSLDLSSAGHLDVVFALDKSGSTHLPTGIDVDRDGTTGVPILDPRIKVASSDPGDSYLVAQVVAAHSVVRGIARNDVKFAVVGFSGSIDATEREIRRNLTSRTRKALPRKANVASSILTADPQFLASTLNDILGAGLDGFTDFSAGINASIDVLTAVERTEPSARRVVLFMSDSPFPMLPGDNGQVVRHDVTIQDAVRRARGVNVKFETFGLARDAEKQPGFLSKIASATGGSYHPVLDLTVLHCELARSLLP